MASQRISYTWSLALEFSNLNIKRHQGNSDNGPGKKRVKGRGGGEKWGLKSTMANKSHQMTMPDSHFNSGTIPLCHAVLSSIDFFPLLLLGHSKGKKWLLLLLLLAPELRLPTIKVNAGTTSRSSSSALAVGGWSITDWSPCSAGSLYILTHKPLSSAKTLSSPRHICLRLPQSFSLCRQLNFKVTPREKSYLLNCHVLVKNSQIKYGRHQLEKKKKKNSCPLQIRNVLLSLNVSPC